MSAGYVDAYDVRRSGRVSLAGLEGQLRYGSATSLPSDLLFGVLLSKSLVALSFFIAKDWLLVPRSGVGAWGLNAMVTAGGAGILVVWERVGGGGARGNGRGKARREPSSPLYPFLFAFESLFALLSISYLSVFRFILLTSFAPLWARGMPFIKTGGRKAVAGSGPSNALFMTVAMVSVSYLVDSTLSKSGPTRSGYLYLLLHLFAAGQRAEIFASYNGDERAKGVMHANGAALGAGVAAVLAVLHSFLASPASIAAASTASSPSSAFFPAPSSSISLSILSAGLLAATYLVADPLLTRVLLTHFPPAKILSAGWPLTVGASLFVGYVGFGAGIGLGEVAVGMIARNAISHISSTDPRSSLISTSSSSSISTGSSSAPAPLLARLSTFYRHLRSTVKTILASPESRRIYFFLCLNLAFMFVQMAYGIWTNSLGLISDSIHMFFDCLALAMGLFASVMANWPSNEIYTYGYSRVETLSGFANGIFLCLISIFIVFEAIQRLIDPPEMNTGQLLTVSAVGLAVNLVGMAATGGHHGHSHGGGGGHGHSHGHSHAPVKSKSTPFLTAKEEEDDHRGHSHNGNGHSHSSHSHAVATPPRPAASSHSLAAHSPPPSHSHSHSHASPSHSSYAHGSHDESSHSSHSHANGSHANGSHDECDHDEHEDEDEHAAHLGGSHNMKGVFLHVLADTLGSVGVIISTLLINRYGWTGFDPLASIFIAVLIFASVVPLVVDSGKLLILDMGEEKEAEVRKALTAINRLEGVSSFTKPRFWQKDPSSMVGSICIQLAPAPGYNTGSSGHSHGVVPKYYANIEKTTARVRRTLRANIGGLEDVVIQVEPTGGFPEVGSG
ncbi:hypothetical protein JCM8547_006743 [Rhodosporidiobolus lusitaniae]